MKQDKIKFNLIPTKYKYDEMQHDYKTDELELKYLKKIGVIK